MVVPMLRPDVFGALASHAGDSLFEACYLPDFRASARILRDSFDGSYDVFWTRFGSDETLDPAVALVPLNTYAMAACYSPDESNPGKVMLPFDVASSRLVDDVWHKWLDWDPVRMAPRHTKALATMRHIYLDAGRSDEYYLDLGAQAFSDELTAAGIDHSLELFDGKHGGIQWRYPRAVRALAHALSS